MYKRQALYHAYSSQINSAKAILLSEKKKTNTQANIVENFDKFFVESGDIQLGGCFADSVYAINKNAPTAEFATEFINKAEEFLTKVRAFRAANV